MSDNQRIVLLNRLISRSVSRAPQEHKPPLAPGWELLKIIEQRKKKGFAVEYLGADDDDDDTKRIKKGADHDCFRLSQFRVDRDADANYVCMLFEFIDNSQQSFPLVHLETFAGREISGAAEERGACSAHVVAKLPNADGFDDGNYRCAFEMVSPITRQAVERFLNRQIRRSGEWEFSVTAVPKGGKRATTKDYRYHGKFDLVSDIGRKLVSIGADGKVLTQVVFTKRSQREAIGQQTAVKHEEVLADIELRISAKQAPSEPHEREGWVKRLRNNYETRGFETKLYYRYASGGIVSGDIHRDMATAADLMMCPKEFITLTKPPKRWSDKFNSEVIDKLKTLLKKEDLWQRAG